MDTTRHEHLEHDIEAREAALYEDWKRYGSHLEEYASEFLGTAFLLFCVVGAVTLMFSPFSPLPHWLPSLSLRLALIGVLLGAASWLVALSPPGRLSGAHLDPAVSAGFWLLDKMHGRDLLGYLLGQMAGAVAGTLLGGLVFGKAARSVQMGSLHPGPQVSFWETVGGELAATVVLTLTIYTCVSLPKVMRWTPGIALVVLTLLIGVDGNFSGAGMNPARWFGPALAASTWRDAAAYAVVPIIAALLAAGLRRRLMRQPPPHTAKLFHDPRYRSIFKNDGAPSRPPAPIRAEAESG
jgi:aquaporin Z